MKLRRFFKGFRYGEKGFTLIELLVVIAILGILAAIVVPNFGNFFGRGQTEACNIEERIVTTATMAYASEEDKCPTAIGDLNAYFEDPDSIIGEYTFTDNYPTCTVEQGDCPATPEE
jgi:type IV pilus assembly protein PilA